MTEKKSCSYGNKQLIIFLKQVHRKIQGVAQSQSAANLRHQEEEKNGQKNKQTNMQSKQTNARAAHRPLTNSFFPKRSCRKQTSNQTNIPRHLQSDLFVRSFHSFIHSFIRSVDATLSIFHTFSCKKRKKSNSYGGWTLLTVKSPLSEKFSLRHECIKTNKFHILWQDEGPMQLYRDYMAKIDNLECTIMAHLQTRGTHQQRCWRVPQPTQPESREGQLVFLHALSPVRSESVHQNCYGNVEKFTDLPNNGLESLRWTHTYIIYLTYAIPMR